MKVIQMGVGGFGEHWSKVLAASDDVEVVALVDVSAAALVETCETFGYDPQICFPTLDAALAQVKADLLICVTPPAYHPEHVTAALQAGLHVICEKPMASTLDECMDMLKAARATDRQFAVSQNYRYQPDIQTMAQLIEDGAIGTIGQIKLDFYKGWYFDEDNFRRTMPNPMIVDMSIHHFDLLRFVTGLEAETVRGEAWNPTWSDNTGDTSTALHFTLNNGAHVVYNASWCAQGDFCNWNGNWLIEGDKGSLVYANGEITLNKANGRYQVTKSKTIKPQQMALTGQALLLRRFVQAAQKGKRAETDVADNLRSIGMVFAAETAVATQRPTPILSPELKTLLANDK
ncbi:MAG: Gfo/Idh/MocA family oxidoreductase [Anaerolineales bacterium]|nr:Gfo/Idh/MocA family oxidoreductase [Anaerolineales bacterium]